MPGLILAEPDYINLAQELALRAVPAWREILDLQQDATKNPDRRAQFAFVRPALSPDPAVRDAFFDSLADVKNRRREPWVLEGLSLPSPPAARRLVGKVHPAQPRDAARHPADRRHLFSEAVDGCDAVGPSLARPPHAW